MKIGQAFLFSVLTVGSVTPALAQVTYRHDWTGGYEAVNPYRSDEDLSYATHPSFQIFETPYGTGMRVVHRCAYPNGWNVTDFSRDMNGIPPGIDHTCHESYAPDRRVRARY